MKQHKQLDALLRSGLQWCCLWTKHLVSLPHMHGRITASTAPLTLLMMMPVTAGGLNTMIYFLRSGVRGVRRAALRACMVMAQQAPILTAFEFASREGEGITLRVSQLPCLRQPAEALKRLRE